MINLTKLTLRLGYDIKFWNKELVLQFGLDLYF